MRHPSPSASSEPGSGRPQTTLIPGAAQSPGREGTGGNRGRAWFPRAGSGQGGEAVGASGGVVEQVSLLVG